MLKVVAEVVLVLIGFFDFPITIGTSYQVRVGGGGRGAGRYTSWTGWSHYSQDR